MAIEKDLEHSPRQAKVTILESAFHKVTPENVLDYLNAVRTRVGAKVHDNLYGIKKLGGFQ